MINRENIKKSLKDKGANLPCTICSNNEFTLLDGYFTHKIYQNAYQESDPLRGPTLPCIIIVCNKCGHIDQHALGIIKERINE